MENYEWEEQTPKKPKDDNKTEQIRDILFGETLRTLEQQFNEMKTQITSITARIERLESELENTKKAVQDLGSMSGTERDAIRSNLQESLKNLETKLADIEQRKVDRALIVSEFVDKIKKD